MKCGNSEFKDERHAWERLGVLKVAGEGLALYAEFCPRCATLGVFEGEGPNRRGPLQSVKVER